MIIHNNNGKEMHAFHFCLLHCSKCSMCSKLMSKEGDTFSYTVPEDKLLVMKNM